ncbi:WXG100 family type VII secretion target [Nocardia panacis]|uniref:WXG100 family type VII secretion target n=1 Tax=Nocardia panacis TaxID=2340916 RepID=UPI00131594E5|nr:WXG100 family type VII secretion target [Nocardia panacis]
MTTDYGVDLNGLQYQIDATAKLESALAALAEEIDRSVADLHITWIGVGATAHKTAHDSRIRALADMTEALATLRQRLAHAHAAYAKVGPTNHQMWPRI